MVDASGIPLAVSLTGGNRNDVTQLIPLIEDLEDDGFAWPRRDGLKWSHLAVDCCLGGMLTDWAG